MDSIENEATDAPIIEGMNIAHATAMQMKVIVTALITSSWKYNYNFSVKQFMRTYKLKYFSYNVNAISSNNTRYCHRELWITYETYVKLR